MTRHDLPLDETSIGDLFAFGEQCTYEIPIYQRNYAWGKDEIDTLVQDVYDAFRGGKLTYYIGTLVTYYRGDRAYEVIDGQQRLTTITLVLTALGCDMTSRLAYRARRKSDDTLRHLDDLDVEEVDLAIEGGYKFARAAIDDIVPEGDLTDFKDYFLRSVHIIHYRVPKGIDLNHYFEVMNSRGEQLEKHEIVKAKLMQKLPDCDKSAFNWIWEASSDMSVYIQRNAGRNREKVFGSSLCDLQPKSFAGLVETGEWRDSARTLSIGEMLTSVNPDRQDGAGDAGGQGEDFLPIIDFPNFLLIVLKITRMSEEGFDPAAFNLDNKELINEFDNVSLGADAVKAFAYTLLKARFLLDNFVVHHSMEDDTVDSNRWKLQKWQIEPGKKGYAKNLCDDQGTQERLTHLLSMFEVSFTARQRKNYLFYVLLYLMEQDLGDGRCLEGYVAFVEELADRYFNEVYLNGSLLNEKNTPRPGSFDSTVISGRELVRSAVAKGSPERFDSIYGNGSKASRGVPLFVFNYLDFRLWKKYSDDLRGGKYREGNREREWFFSELGCGDFDLAAFDQFYFSRTRRSLEHYYPQATANGEDGHLSKAQINCFGNYAMIGSEANSSGSNWDPKTKIDHYLDDASGKVNQVSVASLKFRIMMQVCKDRGKWGSDEIVEHQKKMVSLML